MTLYEVSFWTKKAAYGALILIVVLIGCWIARNFIEKVTEIINRPAAEAPQNGFGIVGAISIKSNYGADNFTPQFSIETPSSTLPTFSELNNIINVFKLDEKPRDLQSDQKARDVAKKLSFTADPKVSNDIIYSWNENSKFLIYNRQYSVFEYYISAFTSNPSTNTDKFNLSNSDSAASIIFDKIGVKVNYLDNSSSNNLINYTVTSDYVNYDLKTRIANKAINSDTAQYVRLNINRSIAIKNSKDNLVDIFDNNTSTNIVSIIMKNTSNIDINNVAQIEFYNWNIDPTKGQTYKIISAGDAYTKLSSDKQTLIRAVNSSTGTPAELTDVNSINKVRVLDVKVGYYQTSQVLTFTQPVYEFMCEGTTATGSNIDLTYYVPALP